MHARTCAAFERPPIDANDQWIAAHVPALDAAPITDKTREFSHTPSLIVKGRPSG